MASPMFEASFSVVDQRSWPTLGRPGPECFLHAPSAPIVQSTRRGFHSYPPIHRVLGGVVGLVAITSKRSSNLLDARLAG